MREEQYGNLVDKWIQLQFQKPNRSLFYTKSKHMAEELKLLTSQVSKGVRYLRKNSQGLSYYINRWTDRKRSAATWEIVHRTQIIKEFLGVFGAK